MATVRRPTNQAGLMDFLGAAGARLTSYLSGQYAYSFANDSGRTVKLHLTDDLGAAGGAERQDYFLTVPGNADGIEVPMKSNMIIVTAGFFRPEDGHYEIFWENRRFAWESGISICTGSRHSVDMNQVCTDVFPGAPAVPKGTRSQGGTHSFRMLMLPNVEDLKGIRVYSRRHSDQAALEGAGQWKSSDLCRALADGSLQVKDSGGGQRFVEPLREAALLALPPGVAAATFSSGWANPEKITGVSQFSDMAPAPPHRQHPREKIREAAGTMSSTYYTISSAAASPMATPACAFH